jgi:hypothetical protein
LKVKMKVKMQMKGIKPHMRFNSIGSYVCHWHIYGNAMAML